MIVQAFYYQTKSLSSLIFFLLLSSPFYTINKTSLFLPLSPRHVTKRDVMMSCWFKVSVCLIFFPSLCRVLLTTPKDVFDVLHLVGLCVRMLECSFCVTWKGKFEYELVLRKGTRKLYGQYEYDTFVSPTYAFHEIYCDRLREREWCSLLLTHAISTENPGKMRCKINIHIFTFIIY